MLKDMKPLTGSYYLRIVLIVLAVAGLLLTLVPAILNWQGKISPQQVNNLMLAGTILWFVPAIFLFAKKPQEAADKE